jgi:hypothetical protein
MANVDDTLETLEPYTIQCNANNNGIDECCTTNASTILGPQTSNACLQRRRALRNFINSQNEIDKQRQIYAAKRRANVGLETLVWNKTGYETLYKEYRRTPTTKFFKKYRKINGCMQCCGNMQIPAKYTMLNYLNCKIKEKAVTEYRLKEYKPNQDLAVYNKYQFINGLWQYEGTVNHNINYCFEGC